MHLLYLMCTVYRGRTVQCTLCFHHMYCNIITMCVSWLHSVAGGGWISSDNSVLCIVILCIVILCIVILCIVILSHL